MNKEQIIDEAYKNYENKYYKGEAFGYKKLNNLEYSPDLKLSQEEFIDKCKKDLEFSETWGLKIEERELSLLERYELMKKLDNWISVHYKEPKTMEYMDKQNVPTKLITLIYKDNTIESYE